MIISAKGITSARAWHILILGIIATCVVSLCMCPADAYGMVNVAKGKSYTIDPKPDYAFCTDGRESTKLTDGAYASHWTDKNMVGWMSNKAIITIDLGKEESFDRIAVSSVGGGVAGVMFPASIELYAGADGIRFKSIGKLTSDGLKQNGSEAYVHQFAADNLWAKGRYIRLVVCADYGLELGKYIFLSEIEVISDETISSAVRLSHTAKRVVTDRRSDTVRSFNRTNVRDDCLIYTMNPFEIVTDTYVPTKSQISRVVSIFASPDEYEPATFAVHAFKDSRNVTVVSSDLTNGKFKIGKENIDIKVLSRWKQLGDANTTSGLLEVVPELLLKDDSAFHSLKGSSSSLPRMESMRTDIPADTSKQVWITVRVPKDAVPGEYRAHMVVKASNASMQTVTLKVRVLPIELASPNKRYGIYFLEGPKELGSDLYVKCLENMKKHGVDFTTIYAKPENLKETLKLYKQAGMKGPVPYLGIRWFNRSVKTVDKHQVSELQKMVKENDFPELLYYGIDELYSKEDVDITNSIFSAIKSAGGRTTVTLAQEDVVNGLGNRLDVPIPFYGTPAFQKCVEIQRGDSTSKYPMMLSYWMGFIENPLLNRMCTGFYLWKSGLDGTCPWAYYAIYDTDPYAESRGVTPRYSALAYPTADGPIDTIEWEGYREGVDDVRYLTTLQNKINELKATRSPKCSAAIKESESLIDRIAGSFSLDLRQNLKRMSAEQCRSYRWLIAQQIMKLGRSDSQAR